MAPTLYVKLKIFLLISEARPVSVQITNMSYVKRRLRELH